MGTLEKVRTDGRREKWVTGRAKEKRVIGAAALKTGSTVSAGRFSPNVRQVYFWNGRRWSRQATLVCSL